jgi:3-oxoacyl-[acyl-carrier-protein] synthase II
MSTNRRAVISGMGLLCPLGESPDALYDSLRDGNLLVPRGDLAARPLAPDAPDRYLGGRNTYSLDRPARLLAASAGLALADSGWSQQDLQREDVALFVGTMFSSAASISRFDCQALREGPAYASPIDFANTVINAPAGQAAIWHGLRGVNTTIATGASSGLQAIGSAAEAIREGRASCALAGGVEELSREAIRAFAEAGMLCESGRPPRPFDPESGGVALAESAALLVVEDASAARRRGARVLAEIRGHAQAFDASRRRDEERSVQTIIRSMGMAMEQAGVSPREIQVVCVSANGWVPLDRHEALALKAVFDTRAGIPLVSAVKSNLSEPLGAGGPLQCMAMIQGLRNREIPAMVDLRSFPDKVVSFVPHAELPRDGVPTCLVNSLSHDGHSCALVLTTSAA